MGNAAIYWQPAGAMSIQTIDLGKGLTDLQVQPLRARLDAVPYAAPPTFSDFGGDRAVRVVLERVASGALQRKLLTLQTHLQSGGVIGVTADTARVWGAFAYGAAQYDDLTIRHRGNVFAGYSAGSLSTGTPVTIESAKPESRREHNTIGATAARLVTLSAALSQDYSTKPIFVRYAWFFPALRLPASSLSRPLVTSDHGLNWTMDLQLIEYAADIATLSEVEALTSGAIVSRDTTLDNVLSGVSYKAEREAQFAPATDPRLLGRL